MERRQRHLVLIAARSFAAKLATPTLIADARGNLVYYNEAAARIIGRSHTDVGDVPASRWAELFATETPDGEPLPLERMPPGIALREGVGERFSFRFEARAGGWLACGPGG